MVNINPNFGRANVGGTGAAGRARGTQQSDLGKQTLGKTNIEPSTTIYINRDGTTSAEWNDDGIDALYVREELEDGTYGPAKREKAVIH